MLKTIDPLLGPDLLRMLAAMGHGDDLAIVDANYPAEASGRPVLHMPGTTATLVLDAVLSLLPLDDFVPEAAWVMSVVGAATTDPPIFAEFRSVLARREPGQDGFARIERFDFYERVRSCFAVVATGERRLYGNIILRKGVVRPD